MITPCLSTICPSIHSHLNDFSLGQISSNFMWSLLLKGDSKFIQMVTVRKSRWPPCPYMVKTLKNLILQNRESFGTESWYIASRTQGFEVYQVCSNDDGRLTFDLNCGMVKFASLYILMGKMLKSHFLKMY